MRVVAFGSRDFDDFSVVADVLLGIRSGVGDDHDFTIIEGQCPYGGADALAERMAKSMGWGHEPFPPKTNTARHFHERNRAMIDSRPDLAVGFVNKPLTESWGSLATAMYARSKKVKTIIVEVL